MMSPESFSVFTIRLLPPRTLSPSVGQVEAVQNIGPQMQLGCCTPMVPVEVEQKHSIN